MELNELSPKRNKAAGNLWVKKVLALVVVLLVLAFAAVLLHSPHDVSSTDQPSTTAKAHFGTIEPPFHQGTTEPHFHQGTIEPRFHQGADTGEAVKTPRPQLTTSPNGQEAPPSSSLPPRDSSWRPKTPSSDKAAHLGTVGAHVTAVLGNPSNQIVVALGAIVVGILFGVVGCSIWHELFVAMLAAMVASATCYAASACGLAPNLFLVIVLLLHVAVAVGFAVHVGIEGFQTLFGAILGVAYAYGTGTWARNMVPGLALVWYQVGAIFGMAVYKVFRKPVVVCLTPILGGLLVSSGLGSLAGRVLPLTWLPPRDASWLYALNTLLGGAGLSSLGFHLGSSLIGGLLLGYVGHRWIAVICPIASVCIGSLVAITGQSCSTLSGTVVCKRVVEWQWTFWGCLTWAVLSATSAYYQVGQMSRRDLGLRVEALIGSPPTSPAQSPRQAISGSLGLLQKQRSFEPPGKAEVLRYTPSPKNAEVPRYSPEVPRYSPASAVAREHSPAVPSRTGPASRPPTSRRPRDVEGYEPFSPGFSPGSPGRSPFSNRTPGSPGRSPFSNRTPHG